MAFGRHWIGCCAFWGVVAVVTFDGRRELPGRAFPEVFEGETDCDGGSDMFAEGDFAVAPLLAPSAAFPT